MQDDISNPPVELNSELDSAPIRERFLATGRVQIDNVLTSDAAARFYTCLSEELPWRLAYNDGDTPLELSREQMNQMSAQDKDVLMNEVFGRASRQFQYSYSDFPVAKTLNDPAQLKFYVHDVLRFINDERFLSFLRDVTGLEGRLFADGHATCFQPGHFLTIHDDRDTNLRRAVAYVFNMTPQWRADWGATLQFFDEDFNIIESFLPGYNVLNIFRVPQAHAVSFVVPYATAKRFGMTGWFHHAE